MCKLAGGNRVTLNFKLLYGHPLFMDNQLTNYHNILNNTILFYLCIYKLHMYVRVCQH